MAANSSSSCEDALDIKPSRPGTVTIKRLTSIPDGAHEKDTGCAMRFTKQSL